MKKMKKIFVVGMILIMTLINVVNANSEVEFLVMKEEGDKYELENEYGTISKFITKKNVKDGEVTIEINLNNAKPKLEKSEVVFVVDNSASMNHGINNELGTKKQAVIAAMEKLVNQIYEINPEMYMSLVEFSDSASVMCKMTQDKQSMLDGLVALSNKIAGSDTKIDVALNRANVLFSKDCKNKIIVLLTDGIAYVNNTKNALKNVEESGTYIISMITGLGENSSVTQAFGTTSNPTAGKLYNIENTSINTVIKDEIFKDINETMPYYIMKDIVIRDYFPKEIIDHFTFKYVSEPNHGNISAEIDKENGCITWKIDKLEPGETATVRYSLKLKNMYDYEIANKIISTNEKVEFNYTDYQNKKLNGVLDESPEVELVIKDYTNSGNNSENVVGNATGNGSGIVQNNISGNNSNTSSSTSSNLSIKGDTTTANKVLPHTGNDGKVILIIVSILLIAYGVYKNNKSKI